MNLSGLLDDLAQGAPTGPLRPGLFDRARRRRRIRWAAAATAVLVTVLSGYAVWAPGRPEDVAAGPAGLPDRVDDPPVWTEPFVRLPDGAAALAFSGPAVPNEIGTRGRTGVAVVGLNRDTYRMAYADQPRAVLSPDGRTLLLAQSTQFFGVGNWRTEAIDLATGARRTVVTGLEPLSWSTDGQHVVMVRTRRMESPDVPPDVINDAVVSVLRWPSAEVAWTVQVSRPDAVEGESTHHVALSPDATELAVTTSRELRVYRADGTVRWQVAVGWDHVAGPAAWLGDGRLAIWRRTFLTCQQSCGWYERGVWRLEFLDAATGAPATGPAYPEVSGPNTLEVVAWRGATAYAVARTPPPGQDWEATRMALLRLDPGAARPVTVVELPEGTNNLDVAADYVDAGRTAGDSSYGFNPAVLVLAAPYAGMGGLAAAGLVTWLWWRRRRRSLDGWSAPPAG